MKRLSSFSLGFGLIFASACFRVLPAPNTHPVPGPDSLHALRFLLASPLSGGRALFFLPWVSHTPESKGLPRAHFGGVTALPGRGPEAPASRVAEAAAPSLGPRRPTVQPSHPGPSVGFGVRVISVPPLGHRSGRTALVRPHCSAEMPSPPGCGHGAGTSLPEPGLGIGLHVYRIT